MKYTCPDCNSLMEISGVPDERVSGYIGFNCKCVGHWTLEKRTGKWYRWICENYYTCYYKDAKRLPLEAFRFR